MCPGLTIAGSSPSPYRYHSGSYYGVPHMGAVATSAINQSRATWTPMFFPKPTLVDRIGCEVTVLAAASTVRLGLYADDGNGRPGALILDAGTIDATTTGTKEITIAQTLSGLVWLCGVSQGGAPTLRAMQSMTGLSCGGSLVAACGGTLTGYFRDTVTGALPDPAGASEGITTALRVVLRAA